MRVGSDGDSNKGPPLRASDRLSVPPAAATIAHTPNRSPSRSPAPYSAVAAKLDTTTPATPVILGTPSPLQMPQSRPAPPSPSLAAAAAARAFLGVPPPVLPGHSSPLLASEFPPLSAAGTSAPGAGSRRNSLRGSPQLGAVSSSAGSSPSMPPLEQVASSGVRSSSPGGLRMHSRTLPLHVFLQAPTDLDHLALPAPLVPSRSEDKGSAAKHAADASAAAVASASTMTDVTAVEMVEAEADSEFESARLFDRRLHVDGDHFSAPSQPDVDMSQPHYATAKQALLAAHAPVAIRILSDGLARASSPMRFADSPLTLHLATKDEGRSSSKSPSFDFFSEHVCAEASSMSHSLSFSASLQLQSREDDEWQPVAWDSPSISAATGPHSLSFSPIRAPFAGSLLAPSVCDDASATASPDDPDGDARRALHSQKARSSMHALLQSSRFFAPHASTSPPIAIATDCDIAEADEFVLLEPQ